MGACLELVGDLVLGNGLLLNSFRVCHAGIQGGERVWCIEIPKRRLQQSLPVVSSPQTIPDRQTSNNHADCPLTVTNIPSGCCPFYGGGQKPYKPCAENCRSISRKMTELTPFNFETTL